MNTKNGLIFFLLIVSVIGVNATDVAVCQALSVADSYTLTVDITDRVGSCFTLGANNIVFDCDGHTIDGDDVPTDYAFTFASKSNLTIKNCKITDYARGIGGTADNLTVFNNTFIMESTDYGIRFLGNNSIFYGNNFTGNATTDAVYLCGEVNNLSIYNNTMHLVDAFYSSGASAVNNLSFTDNNVSSPYNNGLDFNALSYSNVLIANNFFFNQTSGNNLGFIYIRVPLYNFSVFNNSFDYSKYSISAVYAASKNNNFSIVQNNFTDSSNVTAYYAVKMYNSTGLNVSYNQFYSSSVLPQVILQYSDNLTVFGNVFGTTTTPINMTSSSSTNTLLVTSDGTQDAVIANNTAYCEYCSGFAFYSTLANNRNIGIKYNSVYSRIEPVRIFSIGDESATAYNSGTDCAIEYNNFTSAVDDEGTNACHSVYTGFVSNSTVTGNRIINATQGIVIKSSFNITVSNNSVNGSAYNNFYDKGSTNCTFVGNTAIQPNAGSWPYNIRIGDNPGISSATNSTWQDNTLIYTSGVTFPVRVELNSDTVFVNMTYSTADEAIVGNLTRKWWHRALATINNESYGPINVTINNASGFVYNASAATTGYSNYSALTEYVVTLGTRAYANNYTYNATYNGHDISGDFNISSTTTTSANFVECGTLNYNVTLLYALTQGATNCFVVNQSNLIIDGQGYALTGAIGSASKGIFVNASNFTLRNLTLSNFSYGIYVNSSNATNLTNVRVYGNTVDVFVGSFGGSRQLWLTNLTIDNPLGTLANYSLISVSDVVDADTAYEMVWTNASNVPLTYGFVSMAGKFINLTSSIGAPSIDSFTFYWNDSEVTTGNYTEDNFELWRHNTTLGWTLLNNTPNVTFNYLTYSGLIPTSSYALLERLNESTSSNSSGSINSANNGPSLPIVALPTPITTPEQTIVPPRSAPTPTPQITTATPVITSTPEPTQIPSATPQVRVVEEDQTDNTIVQAIAIVVAAAIGGAAYYFGKSIIAKAG